MGILKWAVPKVYAVKHKDENIRAQSRSGGVFTALSDAIFQMNGVVYGCVLNEDFQAVHVRAENEEVRNLMRGSKYVQSKMGDTYQLLKSDLDKNKIVLFVGTSCQVHGLKKFLKAEYENLLCVDIACHGVPSPLVWKNYIKWQEEKAGCKIIDVEFRNKKQFGWREHVETCTFDNGTKINSKIFTNLFYSHNILRPSCYECPYKSIIHPGDITIGDYWGIEKAAPEMDDNKGVSLVLVNNYKGEKFIKKARESLNWRSTKIEDSMQRVFIKPYERPKMRGQFWKDFKRKDFKYIAAKYGGIGFKNNIKRRIKRIKQILFINSNKSV